MAITSLTDDIIATVRLQAYIPTASDISDSDILDLANRVLSKKFVPAIKNLRSDYFLYTKDYTTTTDGSGYTIPDRAVGSTLAALYIVLPDQSIYPVSYVEEGDRDGRLQNASYIGNAYYTNYFIRNNKFYLSPMITGAQTLRAVYACRNGDLIPSSDARQIISKTSTTIQLSSALGTVTTGSQFDIISQSSPFAYAGIDQVATTVVGDTITVSAGVPSDVAVGDWVAPQYKTPIPQIPYDFHGAFVDEIVASVMNAIGDREGYQRAKIEAKESMEAALSSLAPRVDNQNSVYVANSSRTGTWGSYIRRGF